MNFTEIFSKEYLFDPVPESSSGFTVYFLLFFAILVVLAFVVKYLLKSEKKIREKQFVSFLTCGILGLVYVFARYESLPWLASRFFLFLILLTLIIWLGLITVWIMKYISKKKDREIVKEKYIKYLPGKEK